MTGKVGTFMVGLWLIGQCAGLGQSFDCAVAPRSKDNFLEARFRFVIPTASEPIHTILVFIPGTDWDGRSAVDDPVFREMARACHAALLGCYFRGEGLNYDDPTGGSGWAMDQALASLSAQAGRPLLGAAPLLLVGFSQGGMFTFNYICWRPERVKAFAALRAIFPRLEPQKKSFQVPGLLAAGENDEAGRIRSIAAVFLKAKGHDAKWALLFERNSGHDVGRSLELAKSLFEAVCQDGPASEPIFLNARGTEVSDTASEKDNFCYFPNRKVANLWKELNRPTSLGSLMALPDEPRLRDLISVENPQALFKCENGDSQGRAIQMSSQTPGVTIKEIKVTGEGFSIQNSAVGSLPAELHICFAPKNMPWGRAKAEVTISGCLNGTAAGTVVTTVTALVKGAVTPVPSLVYLGVASVGHDTERLVLLKPDHPGVHLANLKLPEGITASVGLPDKDGSLPLHIHWSPGGRLGRMEGLIDLEFDAPQKGLLRIPVVGFVAPAWSFRGTKSGSTRPGLLSATTNDRGERSEKKGES